MFRVRIDIVNDLNSDQLIEVCGPDTYVLVRHELPHGNPHYHAYFKYNTEMKDNTLRQRIKRKFGFLKSSDYSIKKCDEERSNEYVQYMFNTKHGNKWELIDIRNFDNQLLNDLKQNAQKVSDDYASTHKSKSKGPTIWDLAQQVEKEFKDTFNIVDNLGDEIHNFYSNEQRRITVYTDITIKVLRHNHKAFDDNLLRKVIATAMSSTERGREIMRKKMIKSFFIDNYNNG